MAESVRLNIVIKGQKDLKNVEELFRKLIKTMGGVQQAAQKAQKAESDATKARAEAKKNLEKEIETQRLLQKEIKSAIEQKKTIRELWVQERRVILQSNGAYRAAAEALARLEAGNKSLRGEFKQLWDATGKAVAAMGELTAAEKIQANQAMALFKARKQQLQEDSKRRASFAIEIKNLKVERDLMEGVKKKTISLSEAKRTLTERSATLRGATAQEAKEIAKLEQQLDRAKQTENEAAKQKDLFKATLEKEIDLQRKIQKELQSAIELKKTQREADIQVRRVILQSNGAYRQQAEELARLEAQNDDLDASLKKLHATETKTTTAVKELTQAEKIQARVTMDRFNAAKKQIAAEKERRASFATEIKTLRLERDLLARVEKKTITLADAKQQLHIRTLQLRGATKEEIREMVTLQKGIDRLTKSTRAATTQTKKFNTEVKRGVGNKGMYASMSNSLNTVVKRWVGIGVAVRAAQRLTQTLQRGFMSIVRSAIDIGKELERGRIRLGAILANVEMMGKTYKDVAEAGRGYADQLERADRLQRQVLIKSTEVVGTSKELIEMHSRVVALSGSQAATDSERVDFASTLLTITRAMGLQGEKALTESRQLFELTRLQGQTVLQTLGINIEDAREWKRKGTLVAEYNKRFLVFLAAQKDMAQTWENLNESLRVFSRLINKSFSRQTFRDAIAVLMGFREELRGAEKEAFLLANHQDAFNARLRETKEFADETQEPFVQLGEALGRLHVAAMKFVNVFIGEGLKAAADSKNGWVATIDAMTKAIDEATETIGQWDKYWSSPGFVQGIVHAFNLVLEAVLGFGDALVAAVLEGGKQAIIELVALLKGSLPSLRDMLWGGATAAEQTRPGRGVEGADVTAGLVSDPEFFQAAFGTAPTASGQRVFAGGDDDFVRRSKIMEEAAAGFAERWHWASANTVENLGKVQNAMGSLITGTAELHEFMTAQQIESANLADETAKKKLLALEEFKIFIKEQFGITVKFFKDLEAAAQSSLFRLWQKDKSWQMPEQVRGGFGAGGLSKEEEDKQKKADRWWQKQLERLDLQHAKLTMNAKAMREFRAEQKASEALARAGVNTEKMTAAQRAKWAKLRDEYFAKDFRNLKAMNEAKVRKVKEADTRELIQLMEINKAKILIKSQDMDHLDAQEQQLELAVKLMEVELKSQMIILEGGKKIRRFEDAEIRKKTEQLRLQHKLDKEWEDHIASVEESTLDMVQIFDQAFESIENGAKGLGDVFENVGKDMVKRFAKQFLFGKKQEFDLPFKMNLEGFTGPGGIIGQLMGQGGQQGGQSFGSNFFNAVGKFFGGSGGGPSPGGMVFKQGTGWVQRAMGGGGGAGGMGGVGSWGGGGGAGPYSVRNPQNIPFAGADPQFHAAAFPGAGGGGVTPWGSPSMGGAAVSGIAALAGYKGIGGNIGAAVGTMAMSISAISKPIIAFLSNTIGNLAGSLANFIVPGIGFAIGFAFEKLLGALMKPGRIKQDKKEIRAFAKEIGLEGVDPQGGKSLTVRHQQADVEFAEQQGGLSALSLMYVDLDDKISHVFGTMKRFTNQFQVGFLEAGLTMEEANEKVLELAEKMGFTIETVVKQINKFATETSLAEFNEELAETATSGNEMLFLADMLEGAIQIATKFNPLIDATALSNRYLADAFAEAAEKAGVTEEKITSLGDRIRSGDLDVEKAIGELHDIGITSLDIKNIKLDEKQIKEELERAMEQSATAIKGMQSAFAAGIAAGLKGGDVAAAAEAGFKDVFRKALQEKAMADFIEENMADWFDGFDFTQPIDMSSDAFQNLASEIGIAADQLYDLLEAAGLLPDTIAAGDKNLQAMNDSLAQVKQSIIDTQISFAANLVAIGAMNAVDLQQMKHSRTSGQLQMHRDFNLHEGGVWNALESTEQGLRAWVQAFANMRQAEVDMFLARAAEEQRYTQDVIDGINERKEADLEANTLNIEAANKRLESLREERTEISDIAKEAKALATGFQSSADKIEGMIRKIATGSDAFSVGEQLGFLQREEALLRQQLIGAEDEDQPGLFNKLSANLVAQLEMSRNQGTELTDETNATLQELERIQGEALAGATLQRSIEEAMELELRSIDGRIQEQTDLLTFYQKQANVINELAGDAIEAAQDRATAAIDAMRRDTVDRLTKLYDDEMHVWHGIALHMKEGTDMDTKLLTVLERLDETIGDLNTTLGGIPGHAAGFSGMVSRPSLMQVAERGPEYVEVTPSGSVPGPLHLTVAPTINVSGGANGRAVGQQVYRQIEDGIIRSMESGRLRGVLKKGH